MKFNPTRIHTRFFLAGLAAIAAGSGIASGSPASLQYDEIVRVAVGQATPPPPGAFQADLAAIQSRSSESAVPQPAKKHGFGNLMGAVLRGQSPVGAAVDDVSENAASNALGGMLGSLNAFAGFMREGKLARYTFFNGWERVDDVAAASAMITKSDLHQSIVLHLDKKTYSVNDTSAPGAAGAPPAASKATPRAPAAPQAPGSALVDFSRDGTGLGAQTLDGVPTTGYGNTITMAMTQATGSCRNGSFSIVSTQYYSALKDPQLLLATAPASRVPTDPRSMVSRGGCAPTFSVHSRGVTPPAGRFSMYSRMSMQPRDASAPAGSTLVFVTERGNLKTLAAPVAAALFEVPADFVREQP